jgi:hypothetical protein
LLACQGGGGGGVDPAAQENDCPIAGHRYCFGTLVPSMG